MTKLSFHFSLLATGAVMALVSAPAAGLSSEVAFVGTITDRFHAPVPTGVATLSSVDRVLQTNVSAGGRFRFENVPRGAYELEVKAYGFVRQRVSVDLARVDVPPLAIVVEGPSVPDPEGCGTQDSTVYSPLDSNRPQLAGIVRSYTKRKPLQHAEVTLARVEGAQITSQTRSDNQGRFQFESVSAGRYNLRISLRGYLLLETKQFLVPRENNVTVEENMFRDDKKLIIFQ